MVRLVVRTDRSTFVIDDEQLRSESTEIENLLAQIKSLVPGPAWQRVESVIGRIVRLYGAGLAHSLEHALAAGAAKTELAERIAGDDLLGSLLLLHGLHPLPIEERVRRAVVNARAELGLAADELELAGVHEGRVELRATPALGGGAMASRVAEAAIRRLVESVAPEATAIEIVGIPPPPDPGLVQLRVRREAP
jgi:hypothetical protein